MRQKEKYWEHHKGHHPGWSIGLFFILLGVALLVATNDMLHLGSVRAYFTWETAMIFIGALLLLNLQFTGGVLLIAGGFWFFMHDYWGTVPELIKTIYWPGVIILVGLSFIISSFFKRNRIKN
jgi:hypothetical protein